jgi:hypothetical protein
MAMCDANYCFTVIDCGAAGRESDGGVFSRSDFGKRYIVNDLSFPSNDCKLPNSDIYVPYVCVADAAFPLRTNLMKPYGGKNLSPKQMIFNYRLSRSRRTIENAFGILAARWRFLHRTIQASPDRVDCYVRAACVLHNYLQKKAATDSYGQILYCPQGFADTYTADGTFVAGHWRSDSNDNFNVPLTNAPSNRHGVTAAAIRNTLADYFYSDAGSVSWQNDAVFATS